MELLAPALLLASALLASILIKYRAEAERYRAKAALLSAAVERVAAEVEALSAELERAHRMISMYVAERADVRAACAEVERERERLGREAKELAGRLAACEEARSKLASGWPFADAAEEGKFLWARRVGWHMAARPEVRLDGVWIRVPAVNVSAVSALEARLAKRNGVAAILRPYVRRLMSRTEVLASRVDDSLRVSLVRMELPLRPPAVYVKDVNVIAWGPAPIIDDVLKYAEKEEEGYR
jgi:outer membrane murein-binding lipoprotein Lpp